MGFDKTFRQRFVSESQGLGVDALQFFLDATDVFFVCAVAHIANGDICLGASPNCKVAHRQGGISYTAANEGGVEYQGLHKSVTRAAHNLIALRLARLACGVGARINDNTVLAKAISYEQRGSRHYHLYHKLNVVGNVGLHVRHAPIRKAVGGNVLLIWRGRGNDALKGEKMHHQLGHHRVLYKAVDIV